MHKNKMERENRLYKIFLYFDEVRSGYITMEELKHVLEQYNVADEKMLKNIIEEVDVDHVSIAIGGPGLASGVRFRNDVLSGGLTNIAAIVINLHGFEAPSDYETTLIEVVDN